jgi:hypothetical protein
MKYKPHHESRKPVREILAANRAWKAGVDWYTNPDKHRRFRLEAQADMKEIDRRGSRKLHREITQG